MSDDSDEAMPRHPNYLHTKRKQIWLTPEAKALLQAWADREGTTFSAAIETPARLGLGQEPRDAWGPALTSKVEAAPSPPSADSVGIDVGLHRFATLSTGEEIANPRFFRTDQRALAGAQRRLTKAARGSVERKRRRKVVARMHERIRNRGHDFCHQTARRLVDRFGVIAVEDLNVAGMLQNHSLATSIADAAWRQFRAALTYKAESTGRRVVAVNPASTSQACSGCGVRVPKTLAERVHDGPLCGLHLDRDHNAALNILALAVGLHGSGTQSEGSPTFRHGE